MDYRFTCLLPLPPGPSPAEVLHSVCVCVCVCVWISPQLYSLQLGSCHLTRLDQYTVSRGDTLQSRCLSFSSARTVTPELTMTWDIKALAVMDCPVGNNREAFMVKSHGGLGTLFTVWIYRSHPAHQLFWSVIVGLGNEMKGKEER